MIDNFYKAQEIVNEYSKYGKFQLNSATGVLRMEPFVEQRIEVTIDPSVPEDMDLDEIPPHLKQTLELYFVSSEAIHPAKQMIRCVSPGKLQAYNAKVWVDIPYRKEWAAWEGYIKEMETIDYPFVVLPSESFAPRTFVLVNNDKMRLFRSILEEPNRQILQSEFEKTWAHLFNPEALGNPDFPLGAWLHIAETPNAMVDVVTPNGDGTVNVVFTVPPLMSFNKGLSGIVDGQVPFAIDSLIKRCSGESSVIPNSGDQRLLEAFESLRAPASELKTHYQMWEKIYNYYGWKITPSDNDVTVATEETQENEAGTEPDLFKMADIRF